MAKGLDIMRITISGRNIELTDGLKAAVEDKIGKLEKYFTPDTDVFVTLSVEKERQKIEVTIPVPGHIIRSEQVSNDMYVSIDMAVDLLERMIRKYKTKISKYGKGELKFNDEFMEEDVDNHETVTITKSKKFAIKPMDVEEACVQMELLGHNFFVFRNAETFEVNVVYKRKDKSECKKKKVMDDTIYNEAVKLYGLKRFLDEFSRMDTKEVLEVKLWDEYLMYAYIFGIADKVAKQLKNLYPEVIQEYNLSLIHI